MRNGRLTSQFQITTRCFIDNINSGVQEACTGLEMIKREVHVLNNTFLFNSSVPGLRSPKTSEIQEPVSALPPTATVGDGYYPWPFPPAVN